MHNIELSLNCANEKDWLNDSVTLFCFLGFQIQEYIHQLKGGVQCKRKLGLASARCFQITHI